MYKTCIKETIQQGGDTDTNAAIVGGMIGALVGYDKIPEDMKNKVLSFDPTTEGRRRPKFLSIKQFGH